MAKSLHKMTRKDVKLDLNKEIRLEVDVTDFTIGEVLLIKYEDKK